MCVCGRECVCARVRVCARVCVCVRARVFHAHLLGDLDGVAIRVGPVERDAGLGRVLPRRRPNGQTLGRVAAEGLCRTCGPAEGSRDESPVAQVRGKGRGKPPRARSLAGSLAEVPRTRRCAFPFRDDSVPTAATRDRIPPHTHGPKHLLHCCLETRAARTTGKPTQVSRCSVGATGRVREGGARSQSVANALRPPNDLHLIST